MSLAFTAALHDIIISLSITILLERSVELFIFSINSLIIIALGPTATVLAYDLAKEGYQALDMGHFDIEYEWYLRNATKKEKISNKYTNEVSGGNDTENVQDKDYINQIEKMIK